MRDDVRAAEHLVCVADSSSSTSGVVEDRAGMFHAAELERRDQDEVELPETIWNARVFSSQSSDEA